MYLQNIQELLWYFHKISKIIQKTVKCDKWTLFKSSLGSSRTVKQNGSTCRLINLFLIHIKWLFDDKDAVLWSTFHIKLYHITEQILWYFPSNFEVLLEKGYTCREEKGPLVVQAYSRHSLANLDHYLPENRGNWVIITF